MAHFCQYKGPRPGVYLWTTCVVCRLLLIFLFLSGSRFNSQTCFIKFGIDCCTRFFWILSSGMVLKFNLGTSQRVKWCLVFNFFILKYKRQLRKSQFRFFPKPVCGFTVRQLLQKLIYYADSKFYVQKNCSLFRISNGNLKNGRKFQICPKLSKFLF